MKKYIIIGVVVLAILGGIAFISKPVVYENPVQTITNEVIKEVNPLDEQVKQREMELEEKYRTMQSLQARLDVFKAESERLDSAILATQKELASFTLATSSRTQ